MSPLLLGLALASEPPGDPVERAVELASTGLAMAGMDAADLGFEKDYVNGAGHRHDPWRIPGVEGALRDPLSVPGDATALAEALRTGRPTGLVEALAPGAPGEPVSGPSACALPVRRPLREPLCRALGRLAALRPALDDSLGAVPAEIADGIVALEDPSTEEAVPMAEQARTTALRLEAASALDPGAVHGLAWQAAAVAEDLERELLDLPARAWPRVPVIAELDGLRVVVGTTGPDGLRVDGAALVVDGGGDDDWTGAPGPLSVLVDLAGDEQWEGPGGAVRGVTVLVDRLGDDRYVGGSPGPAGAIFGAAVVVDRAGDDRYVGRSWSQGAAEHGLAVLADLGGDDRYQAGIRGQGYGGVQGLGALVDRAGDDVYALGGLYAGVPYYTRRTHGMGQGMAMGLRPVAAGGLGLLYDEGGDDHYRGDLYSQGVAYWLGRGYLVDDAGDDTYNATHYALGAGVHLGVGALIDRDGDDRYQVRGLGLGTGHDLAVGWFLDGGGNDFTSHIDDVGILGSGINDGVGIAIDVDGGDWQPLPDRRRTDFVRGSWGASVFVDGGGSDARPTEPVLRRDGSWRRPEPPSILADLGPELALPAAPEWGPIPAAPAPEPHTVGPVDLGPLGERIDAACGTGSPVGIDDAATWIALLPALERDWLMDGYCLDAALRGLPETDYPALRDAVIAAAEPADRLSARWYARWLVKLDPGAPGLAALDRLAGSPHPIVRAETAVALATLGADPAGTLGRLAEDPWDLVRAAAVHGLVQTGAPPERLAAFLGDRHGARFNAAAGLLAHPDRDAAIAAVLAVWPDLQGAPRWTAVDLLGDLGALDRVELGDDPWSRWHADTADDHAL